MPRLDYKRCRNCNRHADEAGPLSRSRLCEVCGDELLTENVLGIHTKTGPAWRRWRLATAATVLPPDVMQALVAVGVFGVDDGEPKA